MKSSNPPAVKNEWTLDEVVAFVKKHLTLAGKSEDDMYIVKTKNGHHIITSPFNLAEAQKECPLMYEGRKKFQYQVDCGPGEHETRYTKERTGWLHKDGMTLLYANIEDNDA